MSIKFNRRNFLQSAAGAGLGAAGSGLSLRAIAGLNQALAVEEVRVPAGEEKWSTATCTLCPAGCGLRVRTIGKRAVKIQGNPLHPVNRGGLCPKGLAALQALYHPDRLRSPMKNAGTRQEPRWKPVTWEEAIATLAAQIRRLRAAGEGPGLAVVGQQSRGLTAGLFRRFAAACGSPNYLAMPSGLDALHLALYLQQGVPGPVAFDFDRSRYVLSFGANLLEGWGSPASVFRAFGRWRGAQTGGRTKFVQVEPRFSVTAARADEWVAARPGTEAALALGIAYVLIAERLYDPEFVRDHTFGFEDWTDAAGKTHRGFRALVTSEYRLNDVAALTQTPPETILRVAREFGRNRPAVAVGDWQTSTLSGHPYAAMAAHSLNALVGSIDAPGGVLIQPDILPEETGPGRSGALPERVDTLPGALFPDGHLARLPEAIRSGKPYPVKALLLAGVDPVFAMPNGGEFRKAFERVPFIVSMSSFLDDSAAMADLILPASTELEGWQESGAAPAFPFPVQSVSAPVIPARHGTRHPADVLLQVAAAVGGPVAGALPFETFEQYLRAQTERLLAEQRFSVYATTAEETWTRLLERSGWWAPTYGTGDELWEQMQEKGGCWEPIYPYGMWERVLRTRSGRFEFYSQALAEWAAKRADVAVAAGFTPGDDLLALPHQPALPGPPPDFPLLLLPFEVLPLSRGEGAHLPYLQQTAGAHLFEQWESWLEINPETAHSLRISDRDMVWVESRVGRAQVRARVYGGVRPGVVHLPLGYGHTAGGEWGRRGVNPLALIEDRREPLAGLPQVTSTYVRVYRG